MTPSSSGERNTGLGYQYVKVVSVWWKEPRWGVNALNSPKTQDILDVGVVEELLFSHKEPMLFARLVNTPG